MCVNTSRTVAVLPDEWQGEMLSSALTYNQLEDTSDPVVMNQLFNNL